MREFLCIGIADGSNSRILLIPFAILISGQELGVTNDDARRPEVVFERLALSEELRREKEIEMFALEGGIGEELQSVLDIETAAIAHRDGTLDDQDRIRIDTDDHIDHILDMMGIEEVLHRIVIGGSCNDYIIGILISRCAI